MYEVVLVGLVLYSVTLEFTNSERAPAHSYPSGHIGLFARVCYVCEECTNCVRERRRARQGVEELVVKHSSKACLEPNVKDTEMFVKQCRHITVDK